MTRRMNRARHSVLLLAGLALILGGSLIYNYQFAPRTPTASVPAPALSPSSSTPTSTPSPTENTGGTTYVQPRTQGYRGAISALTVYSAANGKVPAAGCSWTTDGETAKYLRCDDTNLDLDHAYIQGSLEWDGCDSLTIANSVVDWEASYWFSVYAACAAPESAQQ